jgi:hypothetical protein
MHCDLGARGGQGKASFNNGALGDMIASRLYRLDVAFIPAAIRPFPPSSDSKATSIRLSDIKGNDTLNIYSAPTALVAVQFDQSHGSVDTIIRIAHRKDTRRRSRHPGAHSSSNAQLRGRHTSLPSPLFPME